MADEQANADESASPESDIKAQSPGGTTTADLVDKDDPKKAEKLTKAGRAIDTDASAE